MRAYPGDLLVHLTTFVVLVDQVRRGKPGAFERAARELHVDRSVLRRRVATMTSWLGAPLLEGRGARLQPSEAGLRLEQRARRMLESAEQLRDDIRVSRERLSIACTGTITTELLPRVLLELERRSPPTHLVVRRAGGAECERLVQGAVVDVGIVRGERPPPGFESALLTRDRLWLVLPAGHPLVKRRKAPSLAEMASLPLVLYGESSRTRARVMDRLSAHGARIRVEVDGKAAALEYVRAGLGASFISLLPGHTLERSGVGATDVTRLFSPSRFFAIGLSRTWRDPVVRDVINHLARASRP